MDKPGTYYMFLSDVLDHTPWYVIAALDHLNSILPEMGDAANEKEALWSDIGLHFRAYRLWAYWLGHVPSVRKRPTCHNFLPAGHGKTRLDGQFGRRQRWTEDIALKHTVSSVSYFARLLNERATAAAKDNPLAPQVKFVVFVPPDKTTLFQKTLSGETMRAEKMNCQSTLAVSSTISKKGKVVIHDHKLTGQASCKSCSPDFIDSNPGEKNHEVSEDAGAGKPHADGWRRAYRKHEPEKQDHNLSKLIAQFDGMGAHRLLPHVPLSNRSKTKMHAARVLLKQQAEKKASDRGVRRHIQEEQASSSSSSSSTSSHESSSSSESSD